MITANTVTKFVQEYMGKHNFKTGGQVNIEVCPFCDDSEFHFYILTMEKETMNGKVYEPGMYDCKKCGAIGNFYQLKEKVMKIVPLVDKTPDVSIDQLLAETLSYNLLKNEIVWDYLTKTRKMLPEAIRHFMLGCETKDDINWISVPWFENGELVNIKYRTTPPADKTFRRITGAKSVLFNVSVLKDADTVIITEGEFDAITLHQNGFTNVVANTLGAQGFDNSWIKLFKNIKKIYICYDQDKEKQGEKGAFKLANKLGLGKCYNVQLPCKDPNEFFVQGGTPEKFKEFLDKAETFKLPNICSIRDAVDKLTPHSEVLLGGLDTEWENINKMAGKFYKGDLIIVSAKAKTGKTMFLSNILMHNAKKGIPGLFYCLEMRPEKLMRRIICSEYLIGKEQIDEEYIARFAHDFKDVPLHFAYDFKNVTPEHIFGTIRTAVKEYGIEVVVFDNLQFLCRSLDRLTQETSKLSKEFKLLAEELNIPIFLVVQPRKVAKDDMPTSEDFRDSSSMELDCDLDLILYRKKITTKVKGMDSPEDFTELGESHSPITLVTTDLGRDVSGGQTLLYCDGEHFRFTKLAPEQETMKA